MKTLLLYGEASDPKQMSWLWDYLTRHHPVGLISAENIVIPSAAFELMVVAGTKLPSVTAERLLVVLHGNCRPMTLEALPSHTVLLVDSSNAAHRAVLSTFSGKVISFGRSQTDTVTLSSCEEDKVVVCLQRAIVTLDGTVLEPMELPCLKPPELAAEEFLQWVTALWMLHPLRMPQGQASLDFAAKPPIAI